MNRKTAVIAGASSGIGMELAPLFAANGYDLILTAREVARAGYEGMRRGKSVVVPGLLNKLMAYSPGFGPAAIALEINRLLLSKRG